MVRVRIHILLLLVAPIVGCRPSADVANVSTQMPQTPRFTFDGRDYRIAEATILAAIGDPYWCDTYNNGRGKSISWSICFETPADEEGLSRHVEFDGFQVNVRNWHDLVGYRARWSGPINPETNEAYGVTYRYDHLLISAGSIQITSRDGTRFRIVASGEDEEGQRFAIDAAAEFRGIYVKGSERDTDETIRARVREYIDDSNLIGSPFELHHQYDSGIRMGHAFYSPKCELPDGPATD